MNHMKTLSLLLLLFASFAIVGCAAWRNGAPPTKVEQSLFTVQTNYVPVVTVATNTLGQAVTSTNFEPNYVYTPGHITKDVETGLNAIPVYGTLAGGALSLAAAFWGWIRSSKNYNVGVTLAQSIESIREFVKTLPNGANYDDALTSWLQQHQADTGTISSVLQMLENDVSNPDAQVAAQQIRQAITSLNASALPPKS